MNKFDIILVILIGLAFVFAAVKTVKYFKSGKCCGSCSQCSGCIKNNRGKQR